MTSTASSACTAEPASLNRGEGPGGTFGAGAPPDLTVLSGHHTFR